ncbi:MAG: transcriptional regulator [Frankiales bacterium]|nr:transcriptional regulator [Frankiales bacterium]
MTATVTRIYTATETCRIAEITYRQCDYWTGTGRLSASRRAAEGSGSRRLYTDEDVLRAALLNVLLQSGLALSTADLAVETLLLADGASLPLSSAVTLTVNVDALRERLRRRGWCG